jgi:ketosteroid isomerase-like protein
MKNRFDRANWRGFIRGMKKMSPILILVLAVAFSGCGGGVESDRTAAFFQAEREHPGEALDALMVERGVARFRAFFENVTADGVRQKAPELYAEDVWFNDTLKTLRGRAAVEAYFLKTLDHVESFGAAVDDVAVSGVNVYVRWTMAVRFKGAKEPVRTIGMTLLRFDRDGRVVLHQDFWDPAAGFYEHLPVVGGLLRWIKSKI